MNTVFVGGSRHVSRLPSQVKERLDNVREKGLRVIVGDANGADKAVQKYLLEASYADVTVFCSGATCRNNLGNWSTKHVDAEKSAKGFQFYAEKDRVMASEADFGLMIWDGKSSGTALNVLRLVRAGKKAVLFNVPMRNSVTFKATADWEAFLAQAGDDLRRDLRDRATQDEWQPKAAQSQMNMLDLLSARVDELAPTKSETELHLAMNEALAVGDPKAIVEALGEIARARGMSQIARDTGLAREGLYRALRAEGNPEFSTVLKVLAATGFKLTATKAAA